MKMKICGFLTRHEIFEMLIIIQLDNIQMLSFSDDNDWYVKRDLSFAIFSVNLFILFKSSDTC